MGKRRIIFVAASFLTISLAACGRSGNGRWLDAGTGSEIGTDSEITNPAKPGTETEGAAEKAEQGNVEAEAKEGNMGQGLKDAAEGIEKNSQQDGENMEGREIEYSEAEGKISVTHTTDKGKIGISLPNGWAYQVKEEKNGDFSIAIHPQEEANGEVNIQYVEFFGVCGTGLVEEDCVINGKEARKGTYDNKEYWDYIAFSGKYKGYVVDNSAGESWWGEYQEQVNEILETLSFGEDVKNTAQVLKLEQDQPVQVDESGERLRLTLQDVDANGGGSVHLSYGENEIQVTDYVEWLRESYVFRQATSHFYVLVVTGFSNDMGGTYLLKVSPEGIENCDYLDAMPEGDLTANYMEMAYKVDVLGSYNGVKHYGILQDKFYTDEQVFDFQNTEGEENTEGREGRKQLVLIRELSADIYGDKEKLKQGTVIYPTGCDTEQGKFYFEYENPRYEDEMWEGSFEYKVKDGGFGRIVDGVDEYELFEMLPYAG